MSSMPGNYTPNLISILCPTRMRPKNVLKLVNSARSMAEKPELLEFLFYVDNDDQTFPPISDVKLIQGPRVWISNAHNALYTNATGEILMTAGDDMEFLTKNWDTEVKNKFMSIPDKIGLVFGNDLGSHAGKIAVHGFFHQNWINTLGTWVQPGRGSLWDFWSSEVAQKLDRFYYLPHVHIKHIHYRQGSKEATFDSTYKYVYLNNSSFDPQKTYRLLERERRIDRILLAEVMSPNPPLETNYLIASFLASILKNKISLRNKRKLLILNNVQVMVLPLRTIINRFHSIIR